MNEALIKVAQSHVLLVMSLPFKIEHFMLKGNSNHLVTTD